MVTLVIISIYFDFSIMAQWLSEKSEDFIDDSVENIHNNIHFAFFCLVSITIRAWCVMKENTLQLHKRS